MSLSHAEQTKMRQFIAGELGVPAETEPYLFVNRFNAYLFKSSVLRAAGELAARSLASVYVALRSDGWYSVYAEKTNHTGLTWICKIDADGKEHKIVEFLGVDLAFSPDRTVLCGWTSNGLFTFVSGLPYVLKTSLTVGPSGDTQTVEDAYVKRAADLFNVKPEDVTPEQRAQAKIVCQGERYGASAAKMLGLVQGTAADVLIAKEIQKPEIDSPSYHDIFVTTKDRPREKLFNLAYDYELSCTRVAGWTLWFRGQAKDRSQDQLVGGEYEKDKWLVIDLNGIEILDSRKRAEERKNDEPGT